MEILLEQIQQTFNNHQLGDCTIAYDELTVEISASAWHECALVLRDAPEFQFSMLVNLTGVDYLHYGVSQWQTRQTTRTGFSRAVDRSGEDQTTPWTKPRFAVIYHLLSLVRNQRIAVRVFPEGDPPLIDSVVDLWPSANWFEREAFDLFGILFHGHPDLRRILTDYGFIGHPFRKDFPLIGEVEMRYDATLQRCVYEPVSIQPRTLVPKVIRQDNRYVAEGGNSQ